MPMVCGYCGSEIEIDGEVCHQPGCLAPVPYGDEDAPEAGSVITAHVCGGKQAHVCPVTKQPHDMSAIVRFKDGGSVACKDCGATAMQIDMMELP